MDTKIRSLLTVTQTCGGEQGKACLYEAFDHLKNVAETRPAVDTPEPFGKDLYVVCGELAFQNGEPDMSKECLKMFFMKTPPTDQFLCRAYMCQAHILAPQSAENPEQLDKAVVYLIKAINMSKENPRYHFLVYNASVLFWQFCRPFLKPNYRQYLARNLHQVVKALDDIDDNDYEWRAQLMIALIECHMDAGRKADASHIAVAAATFIKQHVPTLFKTVFGLMVRHQLADTTRLQKDIKSSPELYCFYKISRLKVAIEQEEPDLDIVDSMKKIISQISGDEIKNAKAKEKAVPKRKSTPEESSERTLSVGDSSDENEEGRRTPNPRGRSPTPTGIRKMPSNSPEKPYLLLEVARLASEHRVTEVASQCLDLMKKNMHLVKDSGFFIETEFLQSELMVRNLGNKEESYMKNAIEVRKQAIKRCDEAIMNAVRHGDPNVVQAGCVTQWNLCLPLLQPNMRKVVRKPLTVVAEALENIQSLLIKLRCQVYMELAKCEEDIEQIQVALSHLKKALALDDGKVYEEKLLNSLHRLELRSELYQQPDKDEDQAAMIIEQARRADSGTIRMKRSLLVRAGQALAPDAFILVLESESDTKDVSNKGPMTELNKLAAKAQRYTHYVKKAEGHLRRLGNENDRQRARLWADLAKTARKQEVWDVCRVASIFCLLYDDNRWKAETPAKPSGKNRPRSKSENQDDTQDEKKSVDKENKFGREPSIIEIEQGSNLFERDLVRTMAEVHFVNAESLIHLLRSEGIELGNKPEPPEDKSKKPKGFVATNPEEDPDWLEYVEHTNNVTNAAYKSFLRAATLGEELQESWIVCSAGAYILNYSNHIIQSDRHHLIVDQLQHVLDGLKKVGQEGENVLFVNIANFLAMGLIQPWVPPPLPIDPKSPPPGKGRDKSPGRKESPKRGGSPKKGKGKGGPPTVTVSPDAGPDLKRAVEVCEHMMKVTNGEVPQNMVPISARMYLLQTWVKARQLQQSQILKGLGVDDEQNLEGQNQMTKAIVGIEMIALNSNGIMEFKEMPTFEKAVELLQAPSWTEKAVELQLWTKLASYAFGAENHDIVVICCNKALEFENEGTQGRGKHFDAHKYMVEQELLSYAASIIGQSYMRNHQGKHTLRRLAMQNFLNSARFASNAKNPEMVIIAARHYWNAILPLISHPIEREILKEPLTLLLKCIADTMPKNVVKEEEDYDSDEETNAKATAVAKPTDIPPIDPNSLEVVADTSSIQEEQKGAGIIGGPEDDLTLRAALYGVLFQSYADQGEWEEGLKAMDQAITDMPRTNHRLLIYKHLVVVKAKLGLSVQMNIQKFKDESEDYVAHMWRRTALCSKSQLEQLQAYQFAIEALNSPTNEWQKTDYLIEFSQWLYCHSFPLEDTIDQLEWAADILLNMKFEKKEIASKSSKSPKKQPKKTPENAADSDGPTTPIPEEPLESDGKGKKGKKKGRTPPSSAKKRDKKDKDGKSTENAEAELDVNVEDFIPVAKETVIGVLPNNPSLLVKDLHDIKQMEGLFRVHALLCEVSGRSHYANVDYCLMAYSYIMRMWQVALSSSGPVMKEIAKNPPAEASGSKSPKGKKGKESKEPVVVKPKRKGPLDAMPQTVEDWAGYDAPDEVLDAFRHDAMKTSGINKNTIDKPTLTLIYLEFLAKELKEIGYSHLALPILAFADVIARSLLKCRPLIALIHLKAHEVCVELNLMNGANFHDKLAVCKLDPEEKALSRAEMALWKEKIIQVKKEELKVKASISQFKMSTTQEARKVSDANKEMEKKMKEDDTEQMSHIGKQVGAPIIREMWTDTAEIFIKNGMYQPARELLNEAFISSATFEDKQLTARILYLFGKLSFQEAQYGQAINFAIKAQKTHHGDEMFWFNTTMLMVDATLANFRDKDKTKKARAIIVHALNVFQDAALVRPNKTSLTGYIIASLEAKLGSVQAEISFGEYDDFMRPKVITALVSACKKLKCAGNKLQSLGYLREAVPINCERADILTRLARGAELAVDKHDYYIQALDIMKETVRLTDQIFQDSHSLASIQEMRNVSTPVQRESAEIKLKISKLMLELFELFVVEEREKIEREARKGSILRAVELLISEEDTSTIESDETELKWIAISRNLADSIADMTSMAHSLAGNIYDLKAESLYQHGRCLRLLSLLKNPNESMLWTAHNIELFHVSNNIAEPVPGKPPQPDKEAPHQSPATADIGVGGDAGTGGVEVMEGGGEEGGGEDAESVLDVNSKEFLRYSQSLNKEQRRLETSNRYLAQATECLTQAVNLAISKGIPGVASGAALELVECYGQYEPNVASQYLALHQSCTASVYLDGLLQGALSDPTLSQPAALFHQRQTLLSNNITTNSAVGPVMKSVLNSLKEVSIPWKRLAVLPNHLDLLKEFPSNYNFVVLQHSPDKEYLYASVMEKPKPSGEKKGKGAALVQPPKAKIMRMKTSAGELDNLLKKYHYYKQDVAQDLLKLEFTKAQFAQREKMLETMGVTDPEKQNQPMMEVLEELEDDERKLKERFAALLQEFEDYMSPLCNLLDGLIRPQSVTTDRESSKKKNQEPEPPNEYLVLLADKDLLEMPLEGLSFFNLEPITSVSREISLQLLYHKTHIEPLDDTADKAKKDKEKNKPPSRIPGLRDATKKQAKIIPLDRPVPPGCLPVETHNFRFIVDPFLDCAETEEKKPIECFNAMLEENITQLTPRWLGVMGNEHFPSQGEFEVYLLESSGFVFYGMERIMCFVPPDKVAAMNLPECEMMVLFDQSQTSGSTARQSKIDVLKPAAALVLEKPVESAMLLGLTGVKTVLTNQWNCTLVENAWRMDLAMKDLLGKGRTAGQTVRLIQSPHKRRELLKQEQMHLEAEKEKELNKDKKDKDKHDKHKEKDKDKDHDKKSETGSPRVDGDEAHQDGEDQEVAKEEEEEMSRSWYNMVCYGCPNMIITQIGKF